MKKRKERPSESGQQEEGNEEVVSGHKDSTTNGTGKVVTTADKETASPPAKQARTLSPAKEQTNPPDNSNNSNIINPASSLRQSSVSVNPRQPQPQPQPQALAWQQAPKVSSKGGSAMFRSSTEKSLSPLPATNTTTTVNRTPEKEKDKSNTSVIDLSAEKEKQPMTNNEKSPSSSIPSSSPAIPSEAPGSSSSQVEQSQPQQNEKTITVAKRPSAPSKIMNAVASAVNQSLEKEQPGAVPIFTGTTNNTSIPSPPVPPRVPRPAVNETTTSTSAVHSTSLSETHSLPQKDSNENSTTTNTRRSPSTVTTAQQHKTQPSTEANQTDQDNNTVANTSIGGGADVAATATVSSLTNTATGGETQPTATVNNTTNSGGGGGGTHEDDPNFVVLELRFVDPTDPLQNRSKGFRVGRTKSLKKMVKKFADILGRNPLDLILEFNDRVIENFNTQTPNDLGLEENDAIIVRGKSNNNNNVVDLT
jgi:hypothetical protein